MKELTAALTELQSNLPVIVKGETADVPTKNGGKYSYTYASLTDVSEALLPLLSKHGLAFTTWPTLRDDGQFVLRYMLLHTSGESIVEDYPLSLQGGPQAQGSLITYARRYTLCAVTGVVPDDDDGQAAQHAVDNRPSPVDLSALDAAIVTAQDVGVDKDWSVTRKYAEQSQGHADKAVGKVRDLIAEAQAGES